MSEELLKDLSEESLTKIKEAIEVKVKEKVSIHVEKALTEQDELYSSKLEQLLKAIDTDHSKKLEKVVEAIDTDRAEKLKMVVKKYEQALNNDAASFKAQLVESISDYLESFLEEKIPTADIQEAVRNKKAIVVLESLRNHLAVDAALQKESIKEAILDGKTQISEASQKLESVIQENAQLKSDLDSIKANLLIEQKSARLDESQKKYVRKVMAGKSADFINENFDYTVKLFNKKTNDRLDTLKEEALSESTKVDFVIEEQSEEQPQVLSPYLKELSKY